METRIGAPSAKLNLEAASLKPSRRTVIKGLLAVGAAGGLMQATPESARADYLEGREKDKRLESLDQYVRTRVSPDGYDQLVSSGLYPKGRIESLVTPGRDGDLVEYYEVAGANRRLVGLFDESLEGTQRVFSIYTIMKGAENIDALSEEVRGILPERQREVEFYNMLDDSLEGKMLRADISVNAPTIIRHPARNDFYVEDSFVMVTPDGKVDFIQELKISKDDASKI